VRSSVPGARAGVVLPPADGAFFAEVAVINHMGIGGVNHAFVVAPGLVIVIIRLRGWSRRRINVRRRRSRIIAATASGGTESDEDGDSQVV